MLICGDSCGYKNSSRCAERSSCSGLLHRKTAGRIIIIIISSISGIADTCVVAMIVRALNLSRTFERLNRLRKPSRRCSCYFTG